MIINLEDQIDIKKEKWKDLVSSQIIDLTLEEVSVEKKFQHHKVSHYHSKVMQYGNIMDVRADGNCGYHAIITLILQKGLIDDDFSVTNLRHDLFNYVRDNKDIVLNNINVHFRNTPLKSTKIEQYLER